MEFHEKLQELRKRTDITQEELAQALFVSRTAVSKWESGRGFPSIESLKAISRHFNISIDELLSGQELLTIAEEDSKTQKQKLQRLIFSLLDCAIILLLFLPFFGQTIDGNVQTVSLLNLTLPLYLTLSYYLFTGASVLLGLCSFWVNFKSIPSLVLSILGVGLFILTRQPYAASLIFAFLITKSIVTRIVSSR